MSECKNCKHYKGDCGKHFIDWNRHINYEIPCEGAMCFEPSIEFLEEQKEKRIREIIDEYSVDEIEAAARHLKGAENES